MYASGFAPLWLPLDEVVKQVVPCQHVFDMAMGASQA
jgi:hypothetical protein